MKKYRWVFLSILCLLISACQGNPQPQTSRSLTIFAAASLTEAFTEIGGAFQSAHPGSELVFNFTGSQQLAQGAPAGVFASANDDQMQAAVTAGRVVADRVTLFVSNGYWLNYWVVSRKLLVTVCIQLVLVHFT